MQTFETIKKILDDVKYKDWVFRLKPKGDGWTLQVIFLAQDNDNPSMVMFPQHCRKYYISQHATKSEIVRSAFLAVRQAEEHEMAELFTYKGERIFNPHVNVDALVEYSRTTKPDVRLTTPNDPGQDTKPAL